MILDAIIGLFGSIFGIVAQAVAGSFILAANLILAGLEMLIGLFVTGFSLGRLKRHGEVEKTKGMPSEHENGQAGPPSAANKWLLTGLLAVIAAIVMIVRARDRTISLVAEDGRSLPYAAVVIQTNNGEQHRRTDNAGNIIVPRFGFTAIMVKDPRYVEQTWPRTDVKPTLVVRRTRLGSGLDKLAGRLLEPAAQ